VFIDGNMMERPKPDEYPAFYERYVAMVDGVNVVRALRDQLDPVVKELGAFPDARLDFRYGPGKWSAREVVGHVLDTERAYGYRLMTFARGHEVPLVRMNQDLYVTNGRFDGHPWQEYLDEFADVRRSHVALVKHLPPEAWDRRGTVGDFTISVRALAFVMVGHVEHHLQVLRERYRV
jgi:hypothetical protein